MTALRQMLRRAVVNLPNAVRYRAVNAFQGFERSKVLFPIDREMASFRAITAEEEAAAALFHSLKIRRYPGAELLDPKLHNHKAAVGFFLEAVKYAVVRDIELTITLTLTEDPPALTVAFPVSQFGVEMPENTHIVMAEPLGVHGTQSGGVPADYFDSAVNKVAGDRRVDKLIDKAANARNRILYAHDTGLPKSEVTLASINNRERRAENCILLAIAVLQVDTHQAFAVQCLQGFLKVIGRPQQEVIT